MEREFIRMRARGTKTPVWICAQDIGAVVHDYETSSTEGKAAVLVQGKWLNLEDSHAAVVVAIEKALAS